MRGHCGDSGVWGWGGGGPCLLGYPSHGFRSGCWLWAAVPFPGLVSPACVCWPCGRLLQPSCPPTLGRVTVSPTLPAEDLKEKPDRVPGDAVSCCHQVQKASLGNQRGSRREGEHDGPCPAPPGACTGSETHGCSGFAKVPLTWACVPWMLGSTGVCVATLGTAGHQAVHGS